MSDDAELVFCPYNYIINPVIRGAMEVDIQGSIVVLDEAQYVVPIYVSFYFFFLILFSRLLTMLVNQMYKQSVLVFLHF